MSSKLRITDIGDPMTKVTLLALNDAATNTIIGPMDFFSACSFDIGTGRFLQPYFEVEIVTTDGNPVRCLNGVLIQPHRSMLDVEKTDVIIVSSVCHIEIVMEVEGMAAVPWLRAQHENGACLAALDCGVFLLAETGLLDGKEATTNRESFETFRRRYPEVLLKPERPITDQNRILCAGSTNSCIDLVAYLAMKIHGPEIALQLVKSHGYYPGIIQRSSCPPIADGRPYDDNPVRISQKWMENNYSQPMNVDQLSKMSGMSRRTFERHFKDVTRQTPLQYLQRIRVETAKRMLEASEKTFQEITYQVGYEDSCYFRKLFEKLTGLSPSDYKEKRSGHATGGIKPLI